MNVASAVCLQQAFTLLEDQRCTEVLASVKSRLASELTISSGSNRHASKFKIDFSIIASCVSFCLCVCVRVCICVFGAS